MTADDSLAGDLRRHLYKTVIEAGIAGGVFAQDPPVRRRWVMNLDWLNEVRKLDTTGARLWHPPLDAAQPLMLLGIPVEIRADGGVPHLEPDA